MTAANAGGHNTDECSIDDEWATKVTVAWATSVCTGAQLGTKNTCNSRADFACRTVVNVDGKSQEMFACPATFLISTPAGDNSVSTTSRISTGRRQISCADFVVELEIIPQFQNGDVVFQSVGIEFRVLVAVGYFAFLTDFIEVGNTSVNRECYMVVVFDTVSSGDNPSFANDGTTTFVST